MGMFDDLVPAQKSGGMFDDLVPQQPSQPRGFMDNAADFIKSIPHGMLTGLTSLPNSNPALSQDEVNTDMAARQNARNIAEQQGITHAPEGRAGRFGDTIGQALGSPLSYVGPGSLALKAGTAVLGGAGSEAAGQATEGTPYEIPARLAGGVAGGMAAGKVFGPSAPEAAIPTQPELRADRQARYTRANSTGLELSPDGVGQFATTARNDLSFDPELAYTPRSAGETFGILDQLGNLPPGSRITAANINQIRKDINSVARKVQPTQTPGVFEPTPDATAAMELSRRFQNYIENLPQDHVLGGDAAAYNSEIKGANSAHSAEKGLQRVEGRVANAQENASYAASLDNQLRIQMRQFGRSKAAQYYHTPEELAQAQLANQGTFGGNVLTQLGRGGAGVVPMMAQAAAAAPAAIATGGASIPIQLAGAAALYGARRAGQAITQNRVQQLADMIAKRSPLYQSRVQALPPPDTISNKAAIVRALLNAAPNQ